MTDAERETAKRDAVAAANRDALAALISRYGLWIPRHDLSMWRPTKESDGSIDGLWQNLTIIATDGILGYFIDRDCEDYVIYAHIQCFSGSVEPLHSIESDKPIKAARDAKPKRKSLLQQATEELERMVRE